MEWVWNAGRRCSAAVLGGIVGAWLGMGAGLLTAWLFGQQMWQTHGRCGGWVLGVISGLVGWISVGRPSGKPKSRTGRRSTKWPFRGPSDAIKRKLGGLMPKRKDPAAARLRASRRPKRLRERLIAGALGGMLGLMLWGLASGTMAMLYFFMALSPFGPGGWWPVLSFEFQAGSGELSARAPGWMIVPWLVLGAVMCGGLGILGALFGETSSGSASSRDKDNNSVS